MREYRETVGNSFALDNSSTSTAELKMRMVVDLINYHNKTHRSFDFITIIMIIIIKLVEMPYN